MNKERKTQYWLKNPLALKDFEENYDREFPPVLKVITTYNGSLIVDEYQCDSIEDAFEKLSNLKDKGAKVKIYDSHRRLIHSVQISSDEKNNEPDYA